MSSWKTNLVESRIYGSEISSETSSLPLCPRLSDTMLLGEHAKGVDVKRVIQKKGDKRWRGEKRKQE
jgi:hypothetical protein